MPDAPPAPANDRRDDYKQSLRVGDCHVDPGALLVTCGDRDVRLTPKAMAVLLELARQPGITVSRDELLDRVWGSTFITPGVVGHAITALRRAFGDAPGRPGYIETIPRIGYRLLAAVEREQGSADAVASPAAPGSTPGDPSGPAHDAPATTDAAAMAQAPAMAPPRPRRRWSALAMLVGCAAAGLAAWVATTASSTPAVALEVADARRLTFDPGSENSPRLDATGDWLVYVQRQRAGATPRLLLQSVHGTETIELAAGAHAERPAWSPDGRRVAHVWRQGSRCRLRIAHVDSAATSDIAGCPDDSVVYLDWNPADGRTIAYSAVEPGQAGGARIRLLSEQSGWQPVAMDYARAADSPDLDPRFSADGRWIAFRRGSNPTSDLYLMPAAGGEVERLTHGRSLISGFDWLPDGSGLVFSSDHRGRRDLYVIWLADRSITALGVPDASFPDVASNDWRVAYQIDDWQSSIAEVPLDADADAGADAAPRPLTASSGRDEASAVSPDGRRVIFVSDRDGSSQLWSLDRDSGALERLTRHSGVRVDVPAFSPDGSHVVYATRAEGHHELWEYGFREAASRRVHAVPASLLDVTYAADGRSLWYVAWDGSQLALHACRRGGAGEGCSGGPTARAALRVERTRVDGTDVLLLATPHADGGLELVRERDLHVLRQIPLPPSNAWTAVGDEVWSLRPGAGPDDATLVATSLRDGRVRLRRPLPGLRPLGLTPLEVTPDRRSLVLPTITENRTDLGIARLQRPDSG